MSCCDSLKLHRSSRRKTLHYKALFISFYRKCNMWVKDLWWWWWAQQLQLPFYGQMGTI